MCFSLLHVHTHTRAHIHAHTLRNTCIIEPCMVCCLKADCFLDRKQYSLWCPISPKCVKIYRPSVMETSLIMLSPKNLLKYPAFWSQASKIDDNESTSVKWLGKISPRSCSLSRHLKEKSALERGQIKCQMI